MATKESQHSVETGLRYTNEDGITVIVDTVGVTAPELRMRAEEMNFVRPGANASAVFRHVIYEDWAPITKIEREPHPSIRYATVYKVS
jgi:hypothetical protein